MYTLNWNSQSSDGMHMMVDEDYMVLMTDTLFSTISNQPFVFPDSREIGWYGGNFTIILIANVFFFNFIF